MSDSIPPVIINNDQIIVIPPRPLDQIGSVVITKKTSY